MRTVSVSEAKNRFSQVLDWVRQGEVILVLDRGVPVARLEPIIPSSGESLEVLERQGLIRRGGEGGVELSSLPLPVPRRSVLEALLLEREESR